MPVQPTTLTAWLPAAHPEDGPRRPVPPRQPGRGAARWLSGRRAGLAVAVISLWLGLLWAAAIQPLNAPDEPAYLQTVMQVRNQHIVPEIHFDFSQDAGGVVIGSPGDAAVRAYAASLGYTDLVRSMPYQIVQPPLYPLVAGLVMQLVPPDPVLGLYVSRLVSVVFSAAAIYCSWAAVRALVPAAPMLAVGVAGAIAFLPEYNFNGSRVGNDSMMLCFGALVYYTWFRGLRDPAYDPWMVRSGVFLGLAVLSKLNALLLIPGLLLVILFRALQAARARSIWPARFRRALRMSAGAAAAILLVSGWWFVRNLIAYGEPSGTLDMNRFYHTHLPLLNWDDPAQRADWIRATWLSWWGFLGWQNLPMPDEFYTGADWWTWVGCGLSGLALLVVVIRWAIRRRRIAAPLWQAALVMAVVAGATIYSHVQYSITVIHEAQGRFLFLLLIPAALLFTAGLYMLAPGRMLKVIALAIPITWLGYYDMIGMIIVR